MYKKVLSISGALIIAQIFNFIFIILGSKLFGAEVYGQYTFVNSISLILSTVFILRGDQFLLSKPMKDIIKNISVFFSFSLFLLLSLLLISCFLLISGVIEREKFYLISLGIITAFSYSNFNLIGSSFLKLDKVSTYAFTAVIKPLIMLFLLLVVKVFYIAPFAMLVSRVFSEFISLSIRWLLIQRIICSKIKFKYNIVQFIRDNFTFCILGTGAGIINIISQQLPMLVLPSLFGYKDIGYFSLAFSLTVVPMAVFLSPIRNLLIKEYSESSCFKYIFIKHTKKLLILSLFFIIFSWSFADYFVSFVWGNDWIDTAFYIKVMSFWVSTGLLNSPAMSYIIVNEKQKLLVKYEMIFLIVKTLVIITSFFIYIKFNIIVIILSLLGVGYNLLLIIIVWANIKKGKRSGYV